MEEIAIDDIPRTFIQADMDEEVYTLGCMARWSNFQDNKSAILLKEMEFFRK